MKIIKRVLLFIAIGFFVTGVRAQFDMVNYKDIQKLMDRQPIVLVTQADEGLIDKYTKKGKTQICDDYKKIIEVYNANMKAVVNEYWNFGGKQVLFKTPQEISEIQKDKSQNGKYYIIYCYSFGSNKRDVNWTINDKGDEITGTISYFAVGLPNSEPMFQTELNHLIPRPVDLVFAVSTANFRFNFMTVHKDKYSTQTIIKSNAGTLAKKTLVILKDKVSPTVMNDIPKYYPGKVKLATQDEYEKSIESGDSTCAYFIENSYNTGQNTIGWIINCSDGALLGSTTACNKVTYYSSDQGYKKPFFEDIAGYCK